MPAEFSVRSVAGVVVVAGEVDLATAPRLDTALHRAAERYGKAVVDLSAVSYLDSAGTAVLFAHAPGGLEVILTPGSAVARVLEISRLATVATLRASQPR